MSPYLVSNHQPCFVIHIISKRIVTTRSIHIQPIIIYLNLNCNCAEQPLEGKPTIGLLEPIFWSFSYILLCEIAAEQLGSHWRAENYSNYKQWFCTWIITQVKLRQSNSQHFVTIFCRHKPIISSLCTPQCGHAALVLWEKNTLMLHD